MNKRTLVIIGLETLIIVILFWMLVFYGKDEYEAAKQSDQEVISSPSHVDSARGAATITLSPEAQELSGIASSALKAATHHGDVSAFGSVIGMDALVELRTRYLAALSETAVVRASLANSQQEYERLYRLNQDNRNISDRAVSVAEASWKADQAKLAAGETAASSLRDTMRQQWGETLADWATQSHPNDAMRQLLAQRAVLLQITLPDQRDLPHRAPLLAEPAGTSGAAVKASFIAASPQTDSAIQGKTYFYLAPAQTLRTGMRLTVHIPAQDQGASGVNVPASAVIWYANRAWVYQKRGQDSFVRLPINTDVETGDGWFNVGALKAGDSVVTTGAQLLLSEEFKYQIKNENED